MKKNYAYLKTVNPALIYQETHSADAILLLAGGCFLNSTVLGLHPNVVDLTKKQKNLLSTKSFGKSRNLFSKRFLAAGGILLIIVFMLDSTVLGLHPWRDAPFF